MRTIALVYIQYICTLSVYSADVLTVLLFNLIIRGVRLKFFFFTDLDLSPLMFSKCRYQDLIRYLALTNIFLGNTAALRKKSTCIQAVP